jgi:hypothetical protein
LVGFVLAAGVTAYSLSGMKARNLWIVTSIFAAATVGWMVLQTRFDAARIYPALLAALPVVVVALVALLVNNGANPDSDVCVIERRRKLIVDARRLATLYTRGQAGGKSFRQYLESTQTYAALRRHLSAEYLKKLNAPRTIYAQADGAKYETLVQWYLDDLDRLEKTWKLH